MITIQDIAEAFKASLNEELQALGAETLQRVADAGEYEHPVQFVTTTDTPHRWSSGPSLSNADSRTGYSPIASLDRAQEIAAEEHVGGYNESRTDTAFGILWEYKP
jgi:hypothetical protein